MRNSFSSAVRQSLAQRNEGASPAVGWLITACLLGVAAFTLTALMVAPEQRESHFVREDGAITALSAVFMAMSSGFAGACFYLSDGTGLRHRSLWLLAAAALGFFALDELLSFHENLDIWIAGMYTGSTHVFRNWNDVIVIGYGVAAVGVLVLFLPEILKYPRFGELLVVAFALYSIHTIIDATQEPGSVSIILEESAKLYCALFLALSMFVGLLGVVGRAHR